jgi:hypothetical protein
MFEVTLRNYLVDSLSAPVYFDMPKDYPSKFFVIERTGGTQVNHIWHSTFAIKSYSKNSLYEAIQLNDELVNAMLNGLISISEVASVDLNGNYNYTDTASKIYRYQAVFDITHY